MPRGKKKCPAPPLTFLHPPFSKQLSEVVYVAPSELHPEVKTANPDEKCSWISPSFKHDRINNAVVYPNRNHARAKSGQEENQPMAKMTLEFVQPSEISGQTKLPCPLFPLKSPESIPKKETILVPETPEFRK